MTSLLFAPEQPRAFAPEPPRVPSLPAPRQRAAPPRYVSPRRYSSPRRATQPRTRRLRAGLLVAWAVLLLSLPLLGRGLDGGAVVAAGGRGTARITLAPADDARSPASGGLIADEAIAAIGSGDGERPNVAGFRFANLAIPPGAVIESVQFSLVKIGDAATPLRLDLAFEAADNAAPFGAASPPEARICTGTVLALAEDRRLVDGRRYGFGNPTVLAAALQEVIDRPGWRSGNGVVLIAYGPAAPAGRPLAFATADAGPDRAPQLVVTYRVPGAR